MAIVNPLVKEKAAPEVRETLEGLTKQFRQDTQHFRHHGPSTECAEEFPSVLWRRHGRRHRRSALQRTRLFEDVATQRLRVLNPRTHRFGEANRNHRRANPGAAVLRPQPVV
jgi:hypothetical protein